MSAAKHTPGPWKTDDHPRRDYPRVVDSRGRFLADCNSNEDARLIAAAPELLYAVQLAQECIGRLPPDVDKLEVFQVLQAAIAKATGGAA